MEHDVPSITKVLRRFLVEVGQGFRCGSYLFFFTFLDADVGGPMNSVLVFCISSYKFNPD